TPQERRRPRRRRLVRVLLDWPRRPLAKRKTPGRLSETNDQGTGRWLPGKGGSDDRQIRQRNGVYPVRRPRFHHPQARAQDRPHAVSYLRRSRSALSRFHRSHGESHLPGRPRGVHLGQQLHRRAGLDVGQRVLRALDGRRRLGGDSAGPSAAASAERIEDRKLRMEDRRRNCAATFFRLGWPSGPSNLLTKELSMRKLLLLFCFLSLTDPTYANEQCCNCCSCSDGLHNVCHCDRDHRCHPLCTCGQGSQTEFTKRNFGVSSDKIAKNEVYSVNGRIITQPAGQPIPDDSGKLHLTIIGNEAERGRVLEDLATAPELAEFRDRFLVQD